MQRRACACLLPPPGDCIGGYIGIMEKKMETLGPFKGIYRGNIGVI